MINRGGPETENMVRHQENRFAEDSLYLSPAFVARWLKSAAWLLLLAVALHAIPVKAQEGRFEVRSANSRLAGGVYYATARIDYRLSEEALEALESGVTLTIQLQIELTRVRRFLPDADVASLEQNYELSYHPLAQHYVVKNLNRGVQSSHVTLFSALRSMGRVVELPLIDAALLESGQRYEIAIRTVLDHDNLPGPLRLLAFWGSGFRLQSDWYLWYLVE